MALEDAGLRVRVPESPSSGLLNPVVIPGVGSFHAGMKALETTGFGPLAQSVSETLPILGICLGMQLLFEQGDEFGGCKGLGLISGATRPLIPTVHSGGETGRTVNTGWRKVEPTQEHHWAATWLARLQNSPLFYFNHSFVVKAEAHNVVAEFCYPERAPAVVGSGGITGIQFHPELSGLAGLKVLEAWRDSL